MIKILGIALIVLGTLAVVYHYQGFTYTETDAQIGPVTIQHDETKTLPLAPIAGGILIAGGAAALLMGNLRNT